MPRVICVHLLTFSTQFARCSQEELGVGVKHAAPAAVPAEFVVAPGDEFYYDDVSVGVVQVPFEETLWDGNEAPLFELLRLPSDEVITVLSSHGEAKLAELDTAASRCEG
jgi:hypothetical protein